MIVPSARLTNEQLSTMTQEQVWSFFAPHMKPMKPTRVEWQRFSDILDDGGEALSGSYEEATRSERGGTERLDKEVVYGWW